MLHNVHENKDFNPKIDSHVLIIINCPRSFNIKLNISLSLLPVRAAADLDLVRKLIGVLFGVVMLPFCLGSVSFLGPPGFLAVLLVTCCSWLFVCDVA